MIPLVFEDLRLQFRFHEVEEIVPDCVNCCQVLAPFYLGTEKRRNVAGVTSAFGAQIFEVCLRQYSKFSRQGEPESHVDHGQVGVATHRIQDVELLSVESGTSLDEL